MHLHRKDEEIGEHRAPRAVASAGRTDRRSGVGCVSEVPIVDSGSRPELNRERDCAIE